MKKQLQTIIWIVIVLLIIWAVYALSQGTTEEEVVGPATGEPIKIGAIMPLTGVMAEYGNDELNAIKLFIKENKLESKLDLVVEDSKSIQTDGVSAFHKILAGGKPDIILTIGSSIALAFQPLSNENQIPVLVVGANPEIAKGYMIQNLPTSGDYVEKISHEINDRGIKKLGILYKNDDLGISVKDNLLSRINGDIYEEAFNADEIDFRTSITKMKSQNVDAMFVVNTGANFGTMIKQIREQMPDIQIYSTPEIATLNVKEAAGKYYTKIIHSDLSKDDSNSVYKEFEDKYMKEYGSSKVSFDSILAYNEMMIIQECLDKKSDLFNCIIGSKKTGLNGSLEVKDNRIRYEIVIKEIE